MQGGEESVVDALSKGSVDEAPVSDAEKRLLEFVEKITRHSSRITADDTQQLRAVGWSDEQIAEAVYIAAMYALFNRVADAFGLEDPGYRQLASQGTPPPGPAERSQPDADES